MAFVIRYLWNIIVQDVHVNIVDTMSRVLRIVRLCST